MNRITNLQTEIEDTTQQLTKIAEVFEKKPIEEKYTLDLLCDFIMDKAERMSAKYEECKQ